MTLSFPCACVTQLTLLSLRNDAERFEKTGASSARSAASLPAVCGEQQRKRMVGKEVLLFRSHDFLV